MKNHISYFHQVLHTSISLFFQQESQYQKIEDIPLPDDRELLDILNREKINFDEHIIMLLALMPHIHPQILDIFFLVNNDLDRPYTEFGGWKGVSHGGFLPTGETAVFILAGDDFERRKKVIRLFDKEHWFYRDNILRLEGQGEGEPFLSGRLRISDEVLSRIFYDREYKPDYTAGFPAKLITTSLGWEDMVFDNKVIAELEEICAWIKYQKTIMEDWELNRFLKGGYRSLFYGPPGTGKTLAATLLGKRNNMDVYRIDLSMIVSKYIGETEKNLAKVFDMAENRNWILFFDEADALFGKRTTTNSSNDRHANQEVAYLLQRIEDFPGIIILATNLLSNIDEAFSRRFQSVIYFPIPEEAMRFQLWKKMILEKWLLNEEKDVILKKISHYELSGGSISNIIRKCALTMLAKKKDLTFDKIILNAIEKELYKEKLL